MAKANETAVAESDEVRNVASKENVRQQLQDDVEKFLASGGSINTIEANVTADPPKKPESNYGRRPI